MKEILFIVVAHLKGDIRDAQALILKQQACLLHTHLVQKIKEAASKLLLEQQTQITGGNEHFPGYGFPADVLAVMLADIVQNRLEQLVALFFFVELAGDA
ncbi:hypothetical protein D3C78_1497670 [compost metagenome]